MDTVECPRISWTIFECMPLESRRVAHVCLRSWKRTVEGRPVLFASLSKCCEMVEGRMGSPWRLGKRRPSSQVPSPLRISWYFFRVSTTNGVRAMPLWPFALFGGTSGSISRPQKEQKLRSSNAGWLGESPLVWHTERNPVQELFAPLGVPSSPVTPYKLVEGPPSFGVLRSSFCGRG